MPKAPQHISAQTLHSGRYINLERQLLRYANGLERSYDAVVHRGAVVIVALDAQRNIHLVRQYRPPIAQWILEVPAGNLEANEQPAAAAQRELAEEAGQRSADIRSLGTLWPAPGYSNEVMHLYLAQELTACAQNLDDDEVLEVITMPFDEACAQVQRGELQDAKTCCAIIRAQHLLAK